MTPPARVEVGDAGQPARGSRGMSARAMKAPPARCKRSTKRLS